jgi:hypothetical protein
MKKINGMLSSGLIGAAEARSNFSDGRLLNAGKGLPVSI